MTRRKQILCPYCNKDTVFECVDFIDIGEENNLICNLCGKEFHVYCDYAIKFSVTKKESLEGYVFIH